jgi:hypothetical protein
VLPVPPVSARCHRCLAPNSPVRTPLLATGPHLSAAEPRVARAPPPSLFRSAPDAPARCAPPTAVRVAQSHRVRAVSVHVAEPLLRFPLHAAPNPPGPPPLPCLPRLCFKRRRSRRARALFSPPSLSSIHSHATPPLVHTGDRAAVVLIIFLTAAVAVSPPPHGETRLSTTIALFGAALTSLVLPCSSKS